jgi:hypothetical protein
MIQSAYTWPRLSRSETTSVVHRAHADYLGQPPNRHTALQGASNSKRPRKHRKQWNARSTPKLRCKSTESDVPRHASTNRTRPLLVEEHVDDVNNCIAGGMKCLLEDFTIHCFKHRQRCSDDAGSLEKRIAYFIAYFMPKHWVEEFPQWQQHTCAP